MSLEKLGGLRFYLSGTEEDHQVEHEYEGKSFEICETCGEPAELKERDGWLRTICDSCEKKRQIFLKLRDDNKYAYCFPEPGNISITDPETEEIIFSGTFGEFMDIIGDYFGLLEDPMSTVYKPLWERI